MKIIKSKVEHLSEIEVLIKYPVENKHVSSIINALTYFNLPILCKSNEKTYHLFPNDIYFIEAYGHKIFIHTKQKTYTSSLKLYQLEEQLKHYFYFRISKSVIVNLKKITSFKAHLNGRLEAILSDQRTVIVSRMYVKELKERLGGLKNEDL